MRHVGLHFVEECTGKIRDEAGGKACHAFRSRKANSKRQLPLIYFSSCSRSPLTAM